MPPVSSHPQESSKKPSLKLRIYYYALALAGILIPLIVGSLILHYPEYFEWLGQNRDKAAIAIFAIAITHFIFISLDRIFKKHIFFSIARYTYILFFIYFIFITGAVNSSFIFLLFFPIITTAVYLDKVTTRNIGIVVTILLAALILFMPAEDVTVSLITKHIIQVALIGVLAYLVYSIVIETLRQRYEKEETSKRLGQMMQIDRLKNDFLSVAQHQLRTPLSGVKWALEMLKVEPAIPSESVSLIDAGLERVKDSIGIINQMLKTVELQEGSLMLNPEAVDVVGILRSIIAELNFITLKKGVKLTFVAPDSLILQMDRNKIKAALINIIDNAIKYSPKGIVNVTLVENQTDATLTVKDTGIGILPEDIPYIFDRLHRGKNAVSIEPDESGVGLYTSKKMIELHGGAISVSSELNKGTTVTVRLPKNYKPVVTLMPMPVVKSEGEVVKS